MIQKFEFHKTEIPGLIDAVCVCYFCPYKINSDICGSGHTHRMGDQFFSHELSESAKLPEMISDNDIDVFYHFAWVGSAGAARADTAAPRFAEYIHKLPRFNTVTVVGADVITIRKPAVFILHCRGSALIKELTSNGIEVIALDREGCNNNIIDGQSSLRKFASCGAFASETFFHEAPSPHALQNISTSSPVSTQSQSSGPSVKQSDSAKA